MLHRNTQKNENIFFHKVTYDKLKNNKLLYFLYFFLI